MKFNYKTVIATTAFVALTSPLMVNAAIKSTGMERSEISITYHASDLNSVPGKAVIETQIRQAARKVCGKVSRTQSGSLRIFSQARACYTESVDRAMTSLDRNIGSLVVTAG
jgi:UrcA family protein